MYCIIIYTIYVPKYCNDESKLRPKMWYWRTLVWAKVNYMCGIKKYKDLVVIMNNEQQKILNHRLTIIYTRIEMRQNIQIKT